MITHLEVLTLAIAALVLTALCRGDSGRIDFDKQATMPLRAIMALALFVLFERFIVLPQWLCRLCVWMAPSMFGVYLLHGPTSFGKLFQRAPLQFLVERGFSPELAIVIAAVACFAICFALDLVRRYALRGIMRLKGFKVEKFQGFKAEGVRK